jgi:hypothetical protein
LILTVPFRLAQSGQSLFAEASYLLLSPLNPDYHKVDSLQPHPTLRQRATLVAQSLVMTYFLMLVALFLPFWHGRRPIQRWLRRRQTRRVIRENAAYNYGATQSVRESAMSWHYQKYFQKLDTDLYRKVIEQTLLDSIIDFLDGKNIDTSELRERQTTILNNGVMISGSSVSGGSFAAGARARVMSAVGSSTGSGH